MTAAMMQNSCIDTSQPSAGWWTSNSQLWWQTVLMDQQQRNCVARRPQFSSSLWPNHQDQWTAEGDRFLISIILVVDWQSCC